MTNGYPRGTWSRIRAIAAKAITAGIRAGRWLALAAVLAGFAIRRRPSASELYARYVVLRLNLAQQLADMAGEAITEGVTELHVKARWGIPNFVDEGH